jgi:hypothetical protein
MQMHYDPALLIRTHEHTMEQALLARQVYRQAVAGRPGLLDRLRALLRHRGRLVAHPLHN